ncbi:hypothetical protein MOQ_004055 [Trypanosoma cruzi marinkellei]|uniref:Uncharacterized protein n=1 Tax=Trypanosoma cruzi marinkellei TaxID=85056 RepID=K2MAG4_TRYCR|nr:hypothetical protein MOQ_004055 [Trypanosoma cruzi marinkellei]
MHAKFHYSATPFKVLPKQPASDTVVRHTLPVHRCGKNADTNRTMCTNLGGINPQHSHRTLALSVHPTPRLKRPRQTAINKIMKRRNQLPCRPFRAPQQRHQQVRASLRWQQCTPLCSWPLGASNTSPTISRSQNKLHADAIHFLCKWRCLAESCANNPQVITQRFFPLSQKKDKNILESQHKYHFAPVTAHCPAQDRCYLPSTFLPSRSCLPGRTSQSQSLPKKTLSHAGTGHIFPLHPGLPPTGGQTGRLRACACGRQCKKLMEIQRNTTGARPRPRIGGSLEHHSRRSKRPLVAFLRSRFITITPPQRRVPASGGDDCSIAPRVGGAHNVALRPIAVSNKPHGRTQHNSLTSQ